ncbi:MAG TPA: sigma 54-interacting transcriptional regulator [Polyangiaceae bacterium]|nr:sigma 54-interacting transcriptional regulator [Polyangiaceae bacterium]
MTFLVKALECENPFAATSRHILRANEEVEIGRGESAFRRLRGPSGPQLELRVPDRTMSARHARLLRVGANWIVRDLGSTNGTLLDGRRIEHAVLRDGQLIEIGATLLLFRETTATAPLLDRTLALADAGALSTLSPLLDLAMARVERIAHSKLSVLVLGETGTGKEGIARAVHQGSKRAGPFVAVNAAAIPAPLLEAHLFGHVKGAFSGAVKDEVGFVRGAHEGTLFLDEIADLPASSQAALLRVLQNGEVTPVGSTRSVQVDVRIVAATHRNLTGLMAEGLFRRDLYARLAGFTHTMPLLAQRREDLGMLIGTLLARHAGGTSPTLRPEAARALFAYSFPLNVRELEQALAAALVLSAGEPITLHHLPQAIQGTAVASPALRSAASSAPEPRSEDDDRSYRALVQALQESRGNVSETARRMGKARQQIQRWLRRFELEPESFRGEDE